MSQSASSAYERVSAGQHYERPSLLFGSPSRIPAADAIDLRWYFRNPPLVGVPESGFSAQLERAAVFSFGVMACLKCGGRRSSPERDGSGWQPIGKLGKLGYSTALKQYRADQAKLAGLLVVNAESAAALALFDGFEGAKKVKSITHEALAELHPYVGDDKCKKCEKCLGTGVIERRAGKNAAITARPTGGSMDGGGAGPTVTIDAEGVVRYGKISRLLESVGRRNLWDRMAIEVYFSEGGSVMALWRYTEAGHGWLGKLPNPRSLAPDALFENERAAQREQPLPARERQLAAVTREADERWDDACRNWNRAVKS